MPLPKSNEWLRGLEATLGLPECSSMMAFANSAGSGLSLHHDRYDQLFFQIRGRKVFQHAPNGYVENPDVQFSPCGPAHPEFCAQLPRGVSAQQRRATEKALRNPGARAGVVLLHGRPRLASAERRSAHGSDFGGRATLGGAWGAAAPSSSPPCLAAGLGAGVGAGVAAAGFGAGAALACGGAAAAGFGRVFAARLGGFPQRAGGGGV